MPNDALREAVELARSLFSILLREMPFNLALKDLIQIEDERCRKALESSPPSPGLVEAAQRVLSLEDSEPLRFQSPTGHLEIINDLARKRYLAYENLRTALAGEEWERATPENALAPPNDKGLPAHLLKLVGIAWPGAVVMRPKGKEKEK